MEFLNEVYFGRKPVEPLRKQLSIIREKFRNKNITSQSSQDPVVLKFNRLAESIFGFHSFSLYIQPDRLPNAYTFPVDTFYTTHDKYQVINALKASPNGFKYNNMEGISAVMALNIGLIDMDIITDDELMATTLHEIGHCFFLAVTSPDNSYTSSRKLSSIVLSILNRAKTAVNSGKYINGEYVDKDINIFTSTINNIKQSFANLKKKKNLTESMQDNMRWSRIMYTNEKFADNFAASYGYAEDISSLNVKISKYYADLINEHPKNYPHFYEVMLMYKMYFNDFMKYVLNLKDVHPEDLARVKTTADYIKREIAREGIDPSMKKELIDELNKINRIIEEYKNFPKDGDSMRIIRLYHIKLYEKFGGDRREKDVDNDALFRHIDKKYYSLNK